MPRYTLSVVLVLLCACVCALDVKAVRAYEHDGADGLLNTIEITLSEPAGAYSVTHLPSERGVRVLIPNARGIQSQPVYQRTSPHLDRIVARIDGSGAVIDVSMMENVRHSSGSADNRIMLNLYRETGRDETAETPPRAPTNGEILRQSQAETDSLAPARGQDLSTADTTRVEETGPTAELGQTRPGERENGKDPSSEEQNPTNAEHHEAENSTLLILALIATGLTLAVVVWHFFLRRQKPLEPEAPEPSGYTGESPAEQTPRTLGGPTLTLDSATRERMVRELSCQGWPDADIARELKIDASEVEQIRASNKENPT